jgi:hypothetical protein
MRTFGHPEGNFLFPVKAALAKEFKAKAYCCMPIFPKLLSMLKAYYKKWKDTNHIKMMEVAMKKVYNELLQRLATYLLTNTLMLIPSPFPDWLSAGTLLSNWWVLPAIPSVQPSPCRGCLKQASREFIPTIVQSEDWCQTIKKLQIFVQNVHTMPGLLLVLACTYIHQVLQLRILGSISFHFVKLFPLHLGLLSDVGSPEWAWEKQQPGILRQSNSPWVNLPSVSWSNKWHIGYWDIPQEMAW